METLGKYSLEWAVLTTSFQHSISGGVKAGKLTFKAAPPQLTCLSVPKHHKDLVADDATDINVGDGSNQDAHADVTNSYFPFLSPFLKK